MCVPMRWYPQGMRAAEENESEDAEKEEGEGDGQREGGREKMVQCVQRVKRNKTKESAKENDDAGGNATKERGGNAEGEERGQKVQEELQANEESGRESKGREKRKRCRWKCKGRGFRPKERDGEKAPQRASNAHRED